MSTCTSCNGRGYVVCPKCGGDGRLWPESMADGVLRDLDPTCDECGGSGTVECTWCDGEGVVDD